VTATRASTRPARCTPTADGSAVSLIAAPTPAAGRSPSRLRRIVAPLAIVAALATVVACAPAPKPPAPGEAAHLLSLLNSYRAAHGLPALASVSDATDKAQAQAQAMAAQHRLFHSNLSSGITPGWRTIGENVGDGGTVDIVHSMFVNSAPHRANMLNASYNQVGVGVVRTSDGLVWVAEEFVGR
jgi:uncharacterized protein YkwD